MGEFVVVEANILVLLMILERLAGVDRVPHHPIRHELGRRGEIELGQRIETHLDWGIPTSVQVVSQLRMGDVKVRVWKENITNEWFVITHQSR
jgi:hypothetical protein